MRNAKFLSFDVKDTYLVFVPEENKLVCKKAFSDQLEAFKFAASAGGIVVEGSHVSHILTAGTSPVEEKIHTLKLEE